MSKDTNIQFCDSTVSPVMGCHGCELWATIPQLVTAISNCLPAPDSRDIIRRRLARLLPSDVFHLRRQLAREFTPAQCPERCAEIEQAIVSNFHCFAGDLHLRHGQDDTRPDKIPNRGYAPKFDMPNLFPGRITHATHWSDLRGQPRLAKAWMNGLPRIIFISDMGDALSSSVTFEYLEEEIIRNVNSTYGRRHFWLWLTKRPSRMAKFAEWLHARNITWPDHLMAMTSITSTDTLGRIEHLRKVPAKYRGLSVEPLLEPVTLPLTDMNWVIVGGESGHAARPFELNWTRDILCQCRDAHVAPFIKQLGAAPFDGGRRINLLNSHGGDWNEWPADLRVREFPPFDSVVVPAAA